MSTLLLKLTPDSSVRGIVGPDGVQRFSVYDFMTVACQKSDNGSYARKTYSNLIKEGSEINNVITFVKFLGPGQRNTPVTTAEGLLKLLNALGNKVSQAFKLEAFDILEIPLEDEDTTPR